MGKYPVPLKSLEQEKDQNTGRKS